MPRRARVVYPGYLYHVTQRGNNRQYIFEDDNDYILYIKRVEEYRMKFNVDLFAYCLMGNHVHFVLRPHTKEAMAQMFRGINMRYAKYFQKKTSGSGHVWQGRFFSCLLQGDYIGQAIRYVELNPVRANMVNKAWQYPWSSARAHLGRTYKWISLADVSEFVECKNWMQYLQGTEDSMFLMNLRSLTKKNMALGSKKFILQLERLLKRRIRPNPNGRPRKSRVRP